MALLPKQLQRLTPDLDNIRKTQSSWVVIPNGFTIGPGWSWTANAMIKHIHDSLQKKGVPGRYLDRWRPLDTSAGSTVVAADGYVFNLDYTPNMALEFIETILQAELDVRTVDRTGLATSVKA